MPELGGAGGGLRDQAQQPCAGPRQPGWEAAARRRARAAADGDATVAARFDAGGKGGDAGEEVLQAAVDQQQQRAGDPPTVAVIGHDPAQHADHGGEGLGRGGCGGRHERKKNT